MWVSSKNLIQNMESVLATQYNGNSRETCLKLCLRIQAPLACASPLTFLAFLFTERLFATIWAWNRLRRLSPPFPREMSPAKRNGYLMEDYKEWQCGKILGIFWWIWKNKSMPATNNYVIAAWLPGDFVSMKKCWICMNKAWFSSIGGWLIACESIRFFRL